jgi:arginyl-tRNA synthetase
MLKQSDIYLRPFLEKSLKDLFGHENAQLDIPLQKTRTDFPGDVTYVVFALTRVLKKPPQIIGEELGKALLQCCDGIQAYNVVQGFLNLEMKDAYWLELFKQPFQTPTYGDATADEKGELLIEYSSPNTNKPLHLGHLRNNFLGNAISNIKSVAGNRVVKMQIINDRGIHICKSMVAWKRAGNGETPDTAGLKGDKLVGKYYVLFDQSYKQEVQELMEKGLSKPDAEQQAGILQEAKQMLVLWEEKDPGVLALWKTMNGWVYDGFDSTYSRMGIDFDRVYFESNTYLRGRDEVLKGLKKGLFYKKEDGSIWVDLTDEGLDHKLLLRSDGTSVYVTQDIGTAAIRFEEYPNMKGMVYTVGNEQEYHFNVLFAVLKKLGYSWADKLQHLSYGMVDLPSGKMKSREGTVVDADDLMDEMKTTASRLTKELGKLEGMQQAEKDRLYEMIGQAALKYFLIKVDPKKRMLFNPEESIDFNGNTGPFIQYTHARIKSVLRKYGKEPEWPDGLLSLTPEEKSIVKVILELPAIIQEAAMQLNPGILANYTYEMVKVYNQFYQSVPILKVDENQVQNWRIILSKVTARTIKHCMALLGMQVPERM